MIDFSLLLAFLFSINTICVKITYTSDVYLEGKVMLIPVQDDITYGYSLNMWYNYKEDTLVRKPCLQCIYVGVVQVNCDME